MKTCLKIEWIFSIAFIFSIICFHSSAQTDTSKTISNVTDTIKYTCSMHPEVISDKPGYCPKCGMKLIKMENGKTETQQHQMKMCPMHGMVGMNHNHDEQNKDNKKSGMIGIMMGGAFMVIMMTVMIIIVVRH
jgi:hypothetical protein